VEKVLKRYGNRAVGAQFSAHNTDGKACAAILGTWESGKANAFFKTKQACRFTWKLHHLQRKQTRKLHPVRRKQPKKLHAAQSQEFTRGWPKLEVTPISE